MALVNNGFTGGAIDVVINQVADATRAGGKIVKILPNEEELLTTCRSSIRGASLCIGAVVFHSSPEEGEGGIWNYTLRGDSALGTTIKVNSVDNDQEIYALPLQHALDSAIVATNKTAGVSGLPEVYEYPYTSRSQEERNTTIRTRYMGGIISILGVAFFIAICGILYQQVGAQASERETRMAQLLECMMPNLKRWQPQVARLLSYHIAFSLIYVPGWIVIAIIFNRGVFARTSIGVLLILHILTGFALASFSLFAAAFFKKAQLSGITAVIVSLLLAVLAQVLSGASTAAVAVLSLLFPSMNYTYFIILMARWESQDLPTNLVKRAPDNPWSLSGIVLWIFLILQIFVYPVLGATVERVLWGTTSSGRRLLSDENSPAAVELVGFSKHFRPSWFARSVAPLFGKKKKEIVKAVNELTLKVLPGQIMVLLGANGRYALDDMMPFLEPC